MSYRSNKKYIYEVIKKSKNILILAHQRPDEDAIGSMIALRLIIERLNINVDTVVTEIPTFSSLFPCNKELLTKTDKEYDLIILVDCSSKSRLGSLEKLYDEYKNIIIFDHHKTENKNSKLFCIDSEASSTTAIIYNFIKYNNIKIDSDIAKCLYIGLLTDTGGFAHSNTTSEALTIASDLIKYSINHNELYIKLIKKEYDMSYLYLEKYVIENLEIIDNVIAFCFINYEILKKYPYENPKKFVDIGRYIRGIEVSLIIVEEEKNVYRMSLRSNKYIDVSRIAEKYNGGGHEKAAGIRFKNNCIKMKENIVEDLIKEIK